MSVDGKAPPKGFRVPSFGRMAMNAAGAAARTAGAFVRGDRIFADSETRAVRDCICIQCEFYNWIKRRCSFCGCKEQWKIYLNAEKCPEGKW